MEGFKLQFKPRKGSWILVLLFIIAWVFPMTATATSSSVSIPNAGFEDGTLTGWSRGSQTGTLGTSINGSGTGVTIFNGSRTFTHGANGAMGSPTITRTIPNTSPPQYEVVDNPYYAPAVTAGSWTFSPKGGTYAVALQPKGEQTFTQATAALGLSGTQTSQITTMLSSQAQASGFGSGNPTDAAWITREVQLTAGITYTMSWNYMATDYVPFNDGSITSLVPVTVASTPTITVNNFNQSYALLGFSNPGTGDYSTNSYGATGWQVSTYKVSVTGTYKLGFTSFNLDDQGLPPVLMIDDQIGTTLSCDQSGSSCAVFGGVEPNNETAPTLPPTTTTTSTTTTTATTTTVPDTTTTTTVPYFNSIQNLTAIANDDGSVTLSWDAPDASNTQPYMYSILFYNLNNNIESGGWGVWTYAANTTYVIDTSGQTGYGSVRFKIQAGTAPCVGEGIGSCLYGPQEVADATTSDPDTTTTTTTIVPQVPTGTTTTTTAPEVVPPPVETLPTENTTVSIPDLDLTPVSTPEPETITTTTISPPVTTIIETIFEPVDTPAVSPEVITTIPEEVTPVVIPEDPTPEIIVPKDTQDAADAAVEDIFDGPMSNAGIADAVDDLVADAETPEQLTAVVSSLLDQELSDTQFATVIESVFDGPMSNENFAAAVDAVFEDPTQLSDAQFEDAVTAVFDGPLSDAQFDDAVAAVFEDVKTLSDEQFDAAVQAVFEEPLSTEQFSAALDNIFDEPISDEKFDSVIDSILDAPISNEQFEELVGVLESDTITEDQVSDAVDSVIENGVTEDQATDLATSEKVLESIDTDQAAEIFDSIPVGDLSVAEEAALVAAVSDAPDEIKDEFETQIDVYGEGLDDYVPTGSQVDVGSRRTLLAATAALSAATVGVGAGTGSSGPSGGSGGSGGGSGGSGGGPGDGTNSNGRKEDENPEGEEEEDPGIEGPEDQEDNHFTRNSIFKYEEETMKRKFSPWGFIKKFSRETSALAFTISGSVVVFATLSGETRKITIIATGCAFLVHYVHAMIKNDED
jgi:hypothetical protein